MAALPLVKLHELKPQVPAAFFGLLAEKRPRTTRDHKPYFLLTFRDRKKSVSATVWSDSPWYERCERDWHPGGLYRIQGVLFDSEPYGPRVEIRDCRDVTEKDKADGFDERDFFERSRVEPATLYDEFVAFLTREFADDTVKAFVLALVAEHAEALKTLPASHNRYHPFPGGWLDHTLSVCRTCAWLCDHYRSAYDSLGPPLNRDLVLAAAALHEIGRVIELAPGPPGQPPEPTVPGRLVGHSILARDLIRDAAAKSPDLNPAFAELLEHAVLTHLSLPEWGSPRLPAIPEVLILHHADDLDAKMEMYARCLANDPSPGPFTEPDPVLKKHLLKRRSV